MSEPLTVRRTMRDILAYLDGQLPQSADDRWAFKLVFSELLFNAVIHGNRSDYTKMLHVKVSVQDSVVCARILDEGDGYAFKPPTDSAVDWHKESGRGLKLVRALVDTLSFDCGGREVVFVKKVGPCDGE